MRRRGFTLIEVLVALAILAIALAAAMRASGIAIDSAEESRLRTLASWVAHNRIAELTATNAFPPAGSSNGSGSMAGIDFTWTQTTSETANAAFRKIELKVSRRGDTRSLISTVAYLTQPPGARS